VRAAEVGFLVATSTTIPAFGPGLEPRFRGFATAAAGRHSDTAASAPYAKGDTQRPLARIHYSEDIDLVQVDAGPIGPVLKAMRVRLDPWLGEPRWKQGQGRATFSYRFESETKPITPLKLKVEINTREHFCVPGLRRVRFQVRTEPR
jgi:hypothetical protein